MPLKDNYFIEKISTVALFTKCYSLIIKNK